MVLSLLTLVKFVEIMIEKTIRWFANTVTSILPTLTAVGSTRFQRKSGTVVVVKENFKSVKGKMMRGGDSFGLERSLSCRKRSANLRKGKLKTNQMKSLKKNGIQRSSQKNARIFTGRMIVSREAPKTKQ